MSDTGVITLPLPDADARERVANDLETNLLVEAGAGSGKTTALVSRMVALVASGTAPVAEIAAVTFTRKAASELRERFQMRVEDALREERAEPDPDGLVEERLARALEDIDRAFIGTIHSFCARLLRERPLEVGLDPGFEELPVEERVGLRRRVWASYLERLTRDSDPILEELSGAGIRPAALDRLFARVVENPDVDFPVEAGEAPSPADLGPIREELEAIVDHGWELMPEREPPRGWDSLQKKIRTLHFTRDVTGWKESADVFEALAALCKRGPRGHSITQNRWKNGALAKALCGRVDAFGVGDTPAYRLVDRWYGHRYGLAIRLARHAAEEFAAHRLRIARLDFQDLLVLAARLLRSNPNVRRHLGQRYRYLLVDEFQDTDPLQAEIVLLLSSDPDAYQSAPEGSDSGPSPNGAEEPDWRYVMPRPGALFVVGDPKQSIYRFRRADIQLYGFVKERFAEFGVVVELTTNFRSRPPVGDLVNELFLGPDFFPEKATPEQAAFDRLNTRPSSTLAVAEGVFVYDIAPEAGNRAAAAADDATRIATWVRDRIDGGEREAGDFLILTRRRGPLAAYARALEAHSVPVQVTGAGVGVEEEIRELEVVLESMIDPANPVKVVSALVGLFFGIDYERLVAHRLEGGRFDVMRPGDRGHPDVLQGLRTLSSWWRASIAEPADIFVSRLVGRLGLLPYAAAGELGTLRAGALVYALDAVRGATVAGDASLPGALAALRAALDLPEAEAPLEPGRPDVVRLMNLHQAKGLEATVVVLADPSGSTGRRPDLHMVRGSDGSALGYARVAESRSGFGGDKVLAVPVGWDTKEATELRFEEAEEVRLTYVAVTRAKEELVVARWPDGRGRSPWASLDPWLDGRAQVLALEAREPDARERLDLKADDAERAATRAAELLRSLATPGFTHAPVTELAKPVERTSVRRRAASDSKHSSTFRGFSWGSAVHGALAAAAADSTDEGLRSTCRDLLVEQGRPLDAHGEPRELGELLELVRTVRRSDLWTRAHAAERHAVEIPFAAPGVPERRQVEEAASERMQPSEEHRQLDLFPALVIAGGQEAPPIVTETPGDGVRVLEGVIDLAFQESGGWVIVDYKTDVGTDPDFQTRTQAYRRQVDLYAEAWSELTGEPVKERVLFYTTQDRVVSW